MSDPSAPPPGAPPTAAATARDRLAAAAAAAPDPLEADATVVAEAAALAPDAYPAGLTSQELSLALRGEMLDHFLLEEFIGGGGMGVVFRALDTTLDRMVAVKVVASHRVHGEELQRRFLVEAQSAARLDHPNIARVHYVGRDRGLPYIVFEYIEGRNLRDLIGHRGPLPPGEALSYAYQIAHALSHACDRDVVHRDIKPSNILVTPHGQAKLVDMGLARLQRERGLDSELTGDGIALGTFDYISPEQARDARQADVRSDIYSLGCTLYFMLAGQPPFAGGAVVEKLLRHQTEQPPSLLSFRGDLSDGLCRLIDRMLAKDPAERHQSARELVADLGRELAELGVEIPQALAPLAFLPPPTVASPWRRRAAWAVPLAALLAATPWLGRVASSPPPPPLPPLPPATEELPALSDNLQLNAAPLAPAPFEALADPSTGPATLNEAPPVAGSPLWSAWSPWGPWQPGESLADRLAAPLEGAAGAGTLEARPRGTWLPGFSTVRPAAPLAEPSVPAVGATAPAPSRDGPASTTPSTAAGPRVAAPAGAANPQAVPTTSDASAAPEADDRSLQGLRAASPAASPNPPGPAPRRVP